MNDIVIRLTWGWVMTAGFVGLGVGMFAGALLWALSDPGRR